MRSLAFVMLAAFTLHAGPAMAQRAPDPAAWRELSLEDTLYVDTAHGRVVLELFPEIAPLHVARVKALAREGFYDGLTFHRVIDKFMAQTGDPLGDGTGGSKLPDLPAEFAFRRGLDMPFIEASAQGGARQGFYKSLPIETQPDSQMAITRDNKARAWGLHCPGVVSMARGQAENTANSQFFFMRASYPSLDGRYTVWGRVVWGGEAVAAVAIGEPPETPDKMLQVRVAADVPVTERAPLFVLRHDSPDFRQLLERTRKERGADFSVCDVQIPVRVPGYGARNEKERPWWRNIPLIP